MGDEDEGSRWEDLYKVLGFEGGGEACVGVEQLFLQIHTAYAKKLSGYMSRLVRRPLRYTTDPVAVVKLHKLGWAFDVLGHPATRLKYDARFKKIISIIKAEVTAEKIRDLERRAAQLRIVVLKRQRTDCGEEEKGRAGRTISGTERQEMEELERQIAQLRKRDSTHSSVPILAMAMEEEGQEGIWRWDDLYKVLGFEGGGEACVGVTSAAAIDRAYRTKAMLMDPVKNRPGDPLAAAVKLEKVEWAFEVLGNPAVRRKYDDHFKDIISNRRAVAREETKRAVAEREMAELERMVARWKRETMEFSEERWRSSSEAAEWKARLERREREAKEMKELDWLVGHMRMGCGEGKEEAIGKESSHAAENRTRRKRQMEL